MNYKTNRQNHDFQIRHFLVGSCHTYDGAYALLCDLREDRANALKTANATAVREEAKRLTAQKKARCWWSKVRRLEGQADLLEIEAMTETNNACIVAAQDELTYIEELMALLEPHRKYRDLPLREAHEAAQAEEWRLELIYRAENFLLTQRSIPHDHFATMRMHPAFKDSIWPEVQKIEQEILRNDLSGLTSRLVSSKPDLPLLLEAKD